MADKVPEDEPTLLSQSGTASLLAADLDEAFSLESIGFKTLQLSLAVKSAVETRLKNRSTSAQAFNRRRGAYQPSTAAEDPDPLKLLPLPQEKPGFEELSGKKTTTANILQATAFTSAEIRDLWVAARIRLAISSTQDWTSAAFHRAVAHISALIPEEDTELRQQLDGVRHLLCFLGKSVEDGFRADATIAASVTSATRRSALKLLSDLSAAQKSTLAEVPISGNSIFGGLLQDRSLSESSEKRRGEDRMMKALSSRPRSSTSRLTFSFPPGRTAWRNQAASTFSSGPMRSQATTGSRDSSRPRDQRPYSSSAPPRGGGRGTTSSASRGRSRHRV